ncbi:Retrovirus-related Pol polyprotein from transposon 17.6 [Araneus ventricosus]|uniref:Retrovirus-related Pol polyprotein from transposon 17.6 n=1 Tax=Araneus ventricosus TaxID=182803 RepID=A0A4Y2DPQ6_ARAVE|nr:Retrovirus-related Pol polyprotein from transposon 17.6 [Araneus ventricosus]
MPKPKDSLEIKKFVEFVTYLSKFLPKLSSICEPRRKLNAKNISFRWSKEQEKAFQSIKMLVTTAPVLGGYDSNKEVTIQVDARKNGLGATLMQEGKPTMFASRSLNKTEQQCTQIEKECLAIVYGCERLHQFISGKRTN